MTLERGLQLVEGPHGIGGLPDGAEHGDAVEAQCAAVWDIAGVDAPEREHRGAPRSACAEPQQRGQFIRLEFFLRPVAGF